MIARRAYGIVCRLPACVHFMFCLAFTLGYVCERSSPVDSSVLLAVALPLLWLAFQPTVRISDGLIEWFLVVATAWLLWMLAIQLLAPTALRCGWWRFAEYAAALSTCLFVAVQRIDPAELLRLLGVAVTCSLAVALAVNIHAKLLDPLQTFCFGFGHINILMCTAGPALLAWWVHLGVGMAEGRKPCRKELIIAICGGIFLLVLMIGTARRGVIASYAAVAIFFALMWLWKQHRTTAIGAIVIGMLALVSIGIHTFSRDLAIGRSERILIYKSGWDAVTAGFPWGLGFYGTLHVQDIAGESARHITAGGSKGTHIHNELLDKFIDGGPVGLALILVLMILLCYRAWHMPDKPMRYAFQALIIAVFAHAMTDNSYGSTTGLVWCGVVAGMILSVPSASPIWTIRRMVPVARWTMWPLTLVSIWGLTTELYPAIIHKDASVEVHIKCMRTALEPQTVDLHVIQLLFDEGLESNDATKKVVIDLAVEKIGWSGMLAVGQGQWAMRSGTPRQQVEAMLRIMGFTAFDKPTYVQLGMILEKHHECVDLVPLPIQRRLAYMEGRPGLPSPNLDLPPDSVDMAADVYAAITWKLAIGKPWSEVKAPLLRLLAKYGDIPGVSQLTLDAVRMAPTNTFPDMLAQADIVLWGLRYPGMDQPILDGSADRTQATALGPLVRRMYPGIFKEFEDGRMVMIDSDSHVALRNALARIWGTTRR